MTTKSFYHIFCKMCILLLLVMLPATGICEEVFLDDTFGNQGKMNSSEFSMGGRGYGVAAQLDGKIVIAGSEKVNGQQDFSLIRLNADGMPDENFGFNGRVTTPIGPYNDEALVVALLSDERIVVAGYSESAEDRDFAIACYLPDGTLDQQFGNQGVVVTQIGNKNDEITSLFIGDDDSIYVSGVAEGTSGQIVVAAKYFPDGFADNSFGEQGMSLIGVGDSAVAQGIVQLADGSLLISGSFVDDQVSSLMLMAFDENGSLKSAFGEDGITAGLENFDSEGYRVAVDDRGYIYVAAAIKKDDNYDAALFRFLEDGSPDADFGEGGYTVVYSGPEDDLFYDVKILGDDRIVASGFTTSNGTRQFLLGYSSGEANEFLSKSSNLTEPINISELKIIENENGAGDQQSQPEEIQVQDLKVFDSYDEFIEPSTAVSFNKDTLLEEIGLVKSFFIGLINDLTGFIVSEAHAEESLEDSEQDFLYNLVRLGFGLDAAGYAMTVTDDGQVIVVGTSTDEEGLESIAAARFVSSQENTDSSEVIEDDDANQFITTLPVSAITRTGAFTGGDIDTDLGTVTTRGVVFSIAPYPVYKGDDGEDSGDTDLSVTITAPVSGSTVTESTVFLQVATNNEATCGYNQGTDIGFDSMIKFPGSSQTSHSVSLTGLSDDDYIYYVRCQDSDGDEAASSVEFTVELAVAAIATDIMKMAAHFVLPEAHAADDDSSGNFLSSEEEEDDFLEEGQTEDGGGSGRYSSILENLKPGTIFYVRAYAIVGGKVFYGNRIQFQTADSCFIATASFGSIFHPCVKVLRDFRDKYLVSSPFGNEMVELYYRISPPVANIITEHSILKFTVRILLLPIVCFTWLAMHFGLLITLLCTASFMLTAGYYLTKTVRKRVT